MSTFPDTHRLAGNHGSTGNHGFWVTVGQKEQVNLCLDPAAVSRGFDRTPREHRTFFGRKQPLWGLAGFWASFFR